MNDIISLAQVRPPRLIGLAVGLAIILVAALHYLFVVPPMDYVNKDFMTFWAGSRAVLDGVNPFDEAVWRPLRAAYGSSWMPNPRSPYPLWTSLAFIPFALLPVPAAAALWLTIQEFLLVATAVVLLRLYARRQFGSLEIIVAGLVAFASVAMILVLINGQMTLFMLFVLALFLYHYEKGNLLAAGVTLALLTLKPNPFIGFLPLVGLWLFWKRERRVIAGGALASFAMLVATWAIVPGWIGQWAAVRSKAEVVTITPTLWGLAAEMGGHMWAPLGFVLVIALLLITGKFVFSRPALGAPAMVSTGMAMSLLVTPYGWTYEHALLFVPWLWLFARAFDGRRAIRLWVVVVGVVPWLVFGLAMVRINDSFGFLVPLMTLCLVLWSARGEESSEVSRSHPFHLDTTNQTF